MPTYDYRCSKCGHQFEVFHGIHEKAVRRCPRCKGRARRVPSGGAGLLFKGQGFYITDYRSKDYKDRAKQEKSAGSKPSSGDSGSTGGSKPGSGPSSGDSGSKGGSKPGSGPSSGDSGSKGGSKPGSGRP